ncbi:CynX/NimT family MFS transporter [Pseudolysinimonas yzui]|uniref:MFS transporter n=1 Tax=Pseudolysinimonas yzui TaxID=2708254 RepID=A0A8J3GSS7_9MICO|nr:MFS transporter [Pseudolysinimonas yzui]GHF26104.1 MFS transporter [Pseudolysinimonas yzui]
MTAGPRREGRILALLGIVLLALGMRSATSSFTPLFGIISQELGLGSVVLGVVGALPPLAFAGAGIVTPWLARRIGSEPALVVAIVAIVAGQVTRAFAGEAVVIVVSTTVTMLGIGVGNVLMPSLVKRFFPARVGLVTALYTTLFAIGGTSPALFSVPVSDAIGWRWTLGIWAITVAIAAGPWFALARRSRTSALDVPMLAMAHDAEVRLTRTPLAWALAAVLLASAMVGYGGTAWLPVILTSRVGFDDATAGAHLGILLAVGIPAAVLVPLVAARPRPAAAIVGVAGVLGTTGWTGLLVAPGLAPALWCAMVGCGALTFPLVLVQVAVRATTARVAVRLSAFVQTFAYIATGAAVLALGVVHEATGGWTAPLVILIAIATLPLAAVATIARPSRVGGPG